MPKKGVESTASFLEASKKFKAAAARAKARVKAKEAKEREAREKEAKSGKSKKSDDEDSKKKGKRPKKEKEDISEPEHARQSSAKKKKKKLKAYPESDSSSDDDRVKKKSSHKRSDKHKKKSKKSYDSSSSSSSSDGELVKRKKKTSRRSKDDESDSDSSDGRENAKRRSSKRGKKSKGKKKKKSYDSDSSSSSSGSGSGEDEPAAKAPVKKKLHSKKKTLKTEDGGSSDEEPTKEQRKKKVENGKKALESESASNADTGDDDEDSYSCGSSSESDSVSSGGSGDDSADDFDVQAVPKPATPKRNKEKVKLGRDPNPLKVPKSPGLSKAANWKNPLQGWNNMPSRRVKQTGPQLQMRIPPETHIWQSTKPRHCHDSAPFHWVKVTGNFEVICKISGGMYATSDKAGIMIRLDPTHWVWTGMEYFENRMNHSTCVTLGTTDHSVAPLPGNSEKVGIWFCMKRDGEVFECFYSFEAKTWTQTRQGLLTGSPTLYVGICGAAPRGQGFKANWEYFRINRS